MERKEKFIRDLNKAFAEGNTEYIIDHVTEDLTWSIVGTRSVEGRKELNEALEKMKEMPPIQIVIKEIILGDNSAAVHGKITGKNTVGQQKKYNFCDIYKFNGSEKLKIREMISYVIDVSKHRPT